MPVLTPQKQEVEKNTASRGKEQGTPLKGLFSKHRHFLQQGCAGLHEKGHPEGHVLEYLVPKYLGGGAIKRRGSWGQVGALRVYNLTPLPTDSLWFCCSCVAFCVLSSALMAEMHSLGFQLRCLLPCPPCHYYGPCSRNSKQS